MTDRRGAPRDAGPRRGRHLPTFAVLRKLRGACAPSLLIGVVGGSGSARPPWPGDLRFLARTRLHRPGAYTSTQHLSLDERRLVNFDHPEP